MAFGEIPRGLDDLKVAVLGAGDVPGTSVDIPGARQLSFTIESDSDQLEGDNSVIAVVRNPKKLSGSIEIGRINLTALGALTGGTPVTTGTPAVTTLSESSASPTIYCQFTGQASSADTNGSAYRVLLKKCLVVSGPDETLQVNEWNTPTLDFEGVDVAGVLLIRSNYTTAVAIP